MGTGHGEKDNTHLLAEDGEDDHDAQPADIGEEMKQVQDIQAELTEMQSRLWENDEMTDEEAEELERQATLLKIRMTAASEHIKQWGMETGLNRLETFQQHNAKWYSSAKALTPEEEFAKHKELLLRLCPIAFLFMFFVFGASTVHFDDSKPIPGHLFPIAIGHPVVWSMGNAEAMVEARIQIQSSSEPGGGGGGHHRRRSGPSDYKPSFLHNDHKWNKNLRTKDVVSKLPSATATATTTPHVRVPPARPAASALHVALPEVRAAARRLLDDSTTACGKAPAVPEPWQAVCDDESSMYYYWDTTTDFVTWEKPAMPGAATPAPAPPASAPSPPSSTHNGHDDAEHGDDDEHAGRGHGDDDGHGVEQVHKVLPVLDIFLFEFKDSEWEHCPEQNLECFRAHAKDEELLGTYTIKDEEQAILMEFHLKDDTEDQYFVVVSEHPEPLAIAINMHSLGPTGSSQVVISAFIMVCLFGMIMTEVLHRTMAAMIGAALCLIMLAIQNRVPSLSKVVGWMDHGTLGLLWGMMLIVGITMRTGVFEWTGVVACKLSKGCKTRLLLLLCAVTAVLSAFLDNVTTILLIAPVTCKLCKLVNIDPRPYLICEAIFSNIGGTATMIGDPPNIIIGNMLVKYVDFNAFLFNLGPGVLLCSPPVFKFLVYYFKDSVVGDLVVDIPKLERMYPITDKPLLIKCGVVLGCVIFSFFLHPVTHLDPAWVAIMGAVWLLCAFDMHHCHEALMAVEWDTLLFFAALFVVVEGVSEMGLLRYIAMTLSGMVEGVSLANRQYFSIALIMWSSAIFSAFVDNIPFTATMVPVMLQLVERVDGISIRPLAWALAFGACFGGNGTLIGASANIVMASKAETEGYHISFMDFFRIGFPVMLISVAVANVYLFLLNAIFWQSIAGRGGGLLTNEQLATGNW